MEPSKGTTLSELLIALALSAIAITMGIPAFATWQMNGKKMTCTHQLLSALQLARHYAANQRTPTSICSGQLTCDSQRNWHGSILVFSDTNLNGQLDAGEQLLHSHRLPEDSWWQWSSFRRTAHLSFMPDGTTHATNGTLTLCLGDRPSQQIVLSATGRPRLQRTPLQVRC